MAALTAASVTYTPAVKATKTDAGRRNQVFIMTFGDGTSTYPTGGIPLSGLSAQGFPYVITNLDLIDPGSANGFLYKFDMTNLKLRIYQGDNANVAAAPAVELANTVAPAPASLKISVTGY